MHRQQLRTEKGISMTIEPPPNSPFIWRRTLTARQTTTGVLTSITITVAVYSGLLLPQESSADNAAASLQHFEVRPGSFSLIPLDEIHSGGPPKDGIPALSNPKTVRASAAGLAPADRVIGVMMDGEARAYPLRILNWHEIANDTLGGKPIAVTYCPLCDSAVVFDRNIGGEVREFGVSGLLYNSNVLMYDRQKDAAKESLWSQMMLAAVVGPAAEAGLELELLPAQLTTWESWLAKYPETTSLSFDTGHVRNYDGNPYEGYFSSPRLMFPAKPKGEPAADAEMLPAKEPTIIVAIGGDLKGYPVSRLREALGQTKKVADEFHGISLVFTAVDEANTTFEVHDDKGQAVPVAFSFWFEFRAAHPKADVFGSARATPPQ